MMDARKKCILRNVLFNQWINAQSAEVQVNWLSGDLFVFSRWYPGMKHDRILSISCELMETKFNIYHLKLKGADSFGYLV